MTDSKILLDSSAWIEYFFTGHKQITNYIESKNSLVFSSVISLHEVKKKLLIEKYARTEIKKVIEFMKNKSAIIELSEEICEKSAEDAFSLKLHTADSLIYRAAKDKEATIITLDTHFKKIKEAIVCEKELQI